MGWRQPGHLTQRPSVRTFLVPASGPFSAAGPPASEEYSPSSRLNHDIPNPIVNGWRVRSRSLILFDRNEAQQLIFDNHAPRATVEDDFPIPKNISTDQNRIVSFFGESRGNDSDGVK